MKKWFRIALFTTAVMNIFGSLTFIPANRLGREILHIPEPHPLYLWILSIWVFAFGWCYLWMAIKQSREWLFIAIGAIGKLSFFGILTIYALLGELPFLTALLGIGDLIFGILFVWWLIQNYSSDK